MVDTTASQAGKPLQQARQIISAVSTGLAAGDRLDIWVVSTPAATRSLTRGLVAPDSQEAQRAAADLTDLEYGSGATDLKNALNKALATMAPNPTRQQAVVFLGDGESTYNPLTEDDRIALGSRMDRDDIGFFAVPLGIKVNSHNLHGLASLTGGTVVRVQEDLGNVNRRAEFLARLKTALDVPVVKVETAKFGDEVGEVYPTRLPPLRADKSTLVVGKLARAAATTVSLKLNGLVAGRKVALDLSHDLPAPRPDHYFLNLMLAQWRDAPHKDAPAMLHRTGRWRWPARRSRSIATSSSSRRPGPSRSIDGKTLRSSTKRRRGSTPTTAKPSPDWPSSRNSRAARLPAKT